MGELQDLVPGADLLLFYRRRRMSTAKDFQWIPHLLSPNFHLLLGWYSRRRRRYLSCTYSEMWHSGRQGIRMSLHFSAATLKSSGGEGKGWALEIHASHPAARMISLRPPLPNAQFLSPPRVGGA